MVEDNNSAVGAGELAEIQGERYGDSIRVESRNGDPHRQAGLQDS